MPDKPSLVRFSVKSDEAADKTTVLPVCVCVCVWECVRADLFNLQSVAPDPL